MEHGKKLGEYTLIKCLGHGSMGSVYLAEHQFMKKQYAVKILPEELSGNRTFVQRFEEDVHLLSELSHPHIVKIHHISFSEGKFFLVMDCIVDEVGETTNLTQYLSDRGKAPDEKELFRMVSQIAEALDYAHKKGGGGAGLIHRNLKPNNILVGRSNEGLRLYLSDYGLSRIIGPGTLLTRSLKSVADALSIGWVIGQGGTDRERYPLNEPDERKLSVLHQSFLQNFAYFSPEQRRGESLITVASDTYSFGVLVYFLLFLDTPEGAFPLPSSQYPHLQYQWDELILSCLRRNPAERPVVLLPLLEKIKQPKKATLGMGMSPNRNAESFLQPPIVVAEPSAEEENEVSVVAEVAFQTKEETLLRPVLHHSKIERPSPDQDITDALHVDPTIKIYHQVPREIRDLEPIHTEMVVIPGGTFFRGSNDGNRDEMPRHQVTINSFAIDIHPVTNEQFVRFLEVLGGEKDSNHHDVIRLRDSRIKRRAGKLIIESGYSKHPVVGVTWYGAVAYAKWVGKRLPFETEWEIAASGGDLALLYPTGDTIERNQANFFSSDTTAVKSYKPNPLGLYDMAGNVYEWCQDWYGYNYYQISLAEPDNPKGPLQGQNRVLRGGCWKSLYEDLPCSRRHRNNPGTVNGTYGFRCAAEVSEGA